MSVVILFTILCDYIDEELNIILQNQGFLQQSIEECPVGQLLYPQTKFPEQSLSESQSPCPTSHWLVAVQHSQSLFAGLHVSKAPINKHDFTIINVK